MKQFISLVCILLAVALNASAQIRVQTRTTKPLNTTVKPTQTTVPEKKPASLFSKTNAYDANSLYTSYTMPDGKRMSMTLKKNVTNYPDELGGIVRKTLHSSTTEETNDDSCIVELKTISAQSKNFMNVNYNSQSIHLYPGAIYRFNDFFSGNYRPIEQGRAPINMRTSNLANTTGPVALTINNPNSGTISTAINSIIQPFSTSAGSSNLQYRIFQSENEAELSIKLSAGGGYGGFSASGGFNFSQKEKKFFLTIDVIKPFYTIVTSAPNGYFTNPAVATDPQLIVLQSVTYGTRILANVEIIINSNEDAVKFNASFGKAGEVSPNGAVTFDYLKQSKTVSSTINAYVVGGPLQTTIFNKDRLLEEITLLVSQCNYQSAQPIAYSFADMNGNVMGIETATDKFVDRKCTPKGKATIQYLTGVTVQVMTTEKKEQGSNAVVSLFNSNNALLFENNQNNTEFSGQNDIVLNKRNIQNDHFNEASFGKSGGFVDIFLHPKQTSIFGDTDAWKISQVTLLLYFKDQDGIPSSRSIQFQTNVNLQKNQQLLRLPFNNLFQAGTPFMPGL